MVGRLSALLPLLCLLCVAPWGVEAQFNVTVGNGTFSEALYNMTLHIPDFNFDFTIAGITQNVTVTNLTCTNLSVESLSGRFVPLKGSLRPTSKELLASDLVAHGLVADCHSLWSYPGAFSVNSGDMNLTLGDGSSLSLLVSLSEYHTPSPSPTPSASPSFTSTSTASASSSVPASASPSPSVPASSSPSPSSSPSSSASASSSSSSSPSTAAASLSSAPSNTMSASPTSSASASSSASLSASSSSSGSFTASSSASVSSSLSSSLSASMSQQVQVALAKALQQASAPVVVVPEGDVAPTFNMSVANCSMVGIITYIHTSDSSLNKVSRSLTETLEELIPGLVCAQSQQIVDTVLNPMINDLAENIWNATTSLQDGAPEEIWSEEAFFYAFLGATVFFLLLFFALCVIPNTYMFYRDYVNSKRADYQERQQEKEPLTKDPEQFPVSGFNDQVVNPRPYNGWAALIIDPRLAWYWRFGLMLVILYNVALFATSTVSIASSVYVYITVGDNVRQLPSLYSFNIITSVIEMWQAPGVWPLSLLIGVASGIWPYVKLIFMFLCMIAPPRILPVVWRKRLLRLLDILGKWSLIDVYVLVFFIEAFRVHIPLSERMAFDMAVEAEYAFFAYLFATILSLALTHVMLFVHDTLEEVQPRDGGRIEQLSNHSFGMRRLVATPLGKYLIPALVVITMALTLIGSGVTAFKLDWSGSLVGNLMLTINGENTRDYSVFSLLGSVPQTSFDDPNGPRVRTIQLAATCFVLVIPLMHLVSLVAVWLLPLSIKLQKNFWYVIEIFYAWAAVEVFIVALVVALLELGDFAAFIISGKCILVDELIDRFAADPMPCFAVKAELEAGSALLVVAVLILLVVTLIIMCVFNRAVHERTEQFHYNRMNIGDEEPLSHSRQSSAVASGFGTLTHTLKLTKIE